MFRLTIREVPPPGSALKMREPPFPTQDSRYDVATHVHVVGLGVAVGQGAPWMRLASQRPRLGRLFSATGVGRSSYFWCFVAWVLRRFLLQPLDVKEAVAVGPISRKAHPCLVIQPRDTNVEQTQV